MLKSASIAITIDFKDTEPVVKNGQVNYKVSSVVKSNKLPPPLLITNITVLLVYPFPLWWEPKVPWLAYT